MEIRISQQNEIMGDDCIGCYNCVDEGVCPSHADAMKLRIFGRRVSPLKGAAVFVAIYTIATYVLLFVFNLAE